jgi:hypothetical protein
LRRLAALVLLLALAACADPQPYGSASGDNAYVHGTAGMLFRF